MRVSVMIKITGSWLTSNARHRSRREIDKIISVIRRSRGFTCEPLRRRLCSRNISFWGLILISQQIFKIAYKVLHSFDDNNDVLKGLFWVQTSSFLDLITEFFILWQRIESWYMNIHRALIIHIKLYKFCPKFIDWNGSSVFFQSNLWLESVTKALFLFFSLAKCLHGLGCRFGLLYNVRLPLGSLVLAKIFKTTHKSLSCRFLRAQSTWRLKRKNRKQWSCLLLPHPFFSMQC